MRRWVFLLLPLLLLGCAAGNFKIAKEEYRERVRTLGVLPLMVDEGSTITYPQRDKVIEMLWRHSAGKEERLMAEIRGQRTYFDVRPALGDPRHFFSQLVRGSSLRGQGSELYRRYQFDGQAAAHLCEENVVDALLVVIINGVERTEKRRDRGPLLSFLEAPFNPVLVTATVVLPSGEIAWEYAGEPGEAFLHLQYPDFDEAYYNKTDEVRVKFIALEGLERTLAETNGGFLGREKFSLVYSKLFEDIAGALHPGLILPLRNKEEKTSPAAAPAR